MNNAFNVVAMIKKIRKQINIVLKPNKPKNELILCHNNQTLNDPADIAEHFSEHFCGIPRNLHERKQRVND